MRSTLTLLLVFASVSLWAQERVKTDSKSGKTTTTTITASPTNTGTSEQINQNPTVESRGAATSAQVSSSPLPYDVEDKYMGRRNEFLNYMTVTELPADFPIYDKAWGVKEYNAVVEAYCVNHQDILKERVKQKIQMMHTFPKK